MGMTGKQSLRRVLAESHIAAVAIAMLLLWALGCVCELLWFPVSGSVGNLITALQFSDFSVLIQRPGAYFQPVLLLSSLAISYFVGAWALSRWVYGVGPLQALSAHRSRLVRRNHV
jgi:hypothetical protein